MEKTKTLLQNFRSYLAEEGRSADRVHFHTAAIEVFLRWLAGKGWSVEVLSKEEIEKCMGDVYPGRSLSRSRRSSMRIFWTFLRGTHAGHWLLPQLSPGWTRWVERLESSLSGRGLSSSVTEQMVREFRFFCRYLMLQGRESFQPSWSDMRGYGDFLRREYLHASENILRVDHKLKYASRCLDVLREDGYLKKLAPRLGYEPVVVRHVLPGLDQNYRLLVAGFREYMSTIGMSDSCVRSYPLVARQFLVWLQLRDVHDIGKVDESMIWEYRSGPVRQTRIGGEASVSTRLTRECVLRKFFGFLYRTRRIHVDPTAHMEFTRKPCRLPRVMLEAQEVVQVFSGIDATAPMGMRDLAVLELLYGVGLRSAELRGLRVTDVQLESRTLFVRGKGGKEALLPFGEKAGKALELYLAFSRPCLARRNQGLGGDVVFLSEYGKSLTPNSLANLIDRLVKAVGIDKKIVPHSLRHSCATHMLRNGADLRVVQQLLRHENINTTLIYTRMLTSDIREAQRKFHPREMQ